MFVYSIVALSTVYRRNKPRKRSRILAMADAAAEPMNGVEGGAPGLPAQNEELDVKHYSSLEFFEVEKKIGHGQFSVVYRARNKMDGKVVALKKIQVGPIPAPPASELTREAVSVAYCVCVCVCVCVCLCVCVQIFDMVDAKARQDCIKEIELLKVRLGPQRTHSGEVS